MAAIARHQALLTMMGLDLQADHGRVTLRAVPLPLRQQNLQKLIPELLGYLAEHQEMSPAVLATGSLAALAANMSSGTPRKRYNC